MGAFPPAESSSCRETPLPQKWHLGRLLAVSSPTHTLARNGLRGDLEQPGLAAGHVPDRDFLGTYSAGAVQDRWRVILNTTPSGKIYRIDLSHVNSSNLSFPRASLTFIFGLANIGKESLQITWLQAPTHLLYFSHGHIRNIISSRMNRL